MFHVEQLGIWVSPGSMFHVEQLSSRREVPRGTIGKLLQLGRMFHVEQLEIWVSPGPTVPRGTIEIWVRCSTWNNRDSGPRGDVPRGTIRPGTRAKTECSTWNNLSAHPNKRRMFYVEQLVKLAAGTMFHVEQLGIWVLQVRCSTWNN